MRVLAHIHTFNDADVIDQTIQALRQQTRPPDGILVVDNASTDGTIDRPSLKYATLLRHPENRGTSGTVHTGFRFALEHGYDWIWLFDADSVPEPDALEKLLELFDSFPDSLKEETAFLACLYHNVEDGIPRHGGFFTPRGLAPSRPPAEGRYYPCHFTIWSGCLYRLAATPRIGLPNADYVLDWGEGEYGYRVMKAGFKGFIHQDAILNHNIRGDKSFRPVPLKFGPITITLFEVSPIRCYYGCRNILYFALYDFRENRLGFVRSIARGMVERPLSLLLKPRHHGKHILACFRGMWHGVIGNIAARY